MARSEDKIGILGDGAWGTTLALLLRDNGLEACVWGHDNEYIKQVNARQENFVYLPGFSTKGINFTSDLGAFLSSYGTIVLALPSRFASPVIKKGLAADPNAKKKKWCIATKGMDLTNLMPFSDIIKKRLSPKAVAVISGPAIASEVAQGRPTAVVCAGRPVNFAVFLRGVFSSESFRVYSSRDIKGVELGGAFKNIIAIAAGICDGLNLGINAKSALVTRGLAEISRMAVAMGGKKRTLYGISGIGDLMTTCFSPLSRNRSFGEAIAKGKNPKDLLGSSKTAIEGAYTVKAVVKLARKYNIDMPISRQVYNIIFKGANLASAMQKLMSRPLKHED